eukprot:2227007-Pyramimonas_sp.AAC.1
MAIRILVLPAALQCLAVRPGLASECGSAGAWRRKGDFSPPFRCRSPRLCFPTCRDVWAGHLPTLSASQ